MAEEKSCAQAGSEELVEWLGNSLSSRERSRYPGRVPGSPASHADARIIPEVMNCFLILPCFS